MGASRGQVGRVWRAVGWERQGCQNLPWELGLQPGIEEVAKFGSDSKEGILSVRESLELQPITGVALVAATAPGVLVSRSVSITDLDKWESS